MELINFFILGIIGGVISGLLGIGGVLMLPLLFYFTDVSTKAATAIAMIQIFSGALFGSIFNYFQKNINFKYAVTLGLSSMIFCFLGSFFTNYFADLTIKIIYLISVLVAIALFFIKEKENYKEIIFNRKTIIKLIPIGAIAGFVGGIIGLGSGYIYVPILILFFGFPVNIAIGTTLLVVLFNSVPGIVGKMISVEFDILAGVIVAIGSIIGVRLGTYLNKKINPRIIRKLFIFLLILIILAVSFDLYFLLI
jgi:uncharacterized membrane protein YfcA